MKGFLIDLVRLRNSPAWSAMTPDQREAWNSKARHRVTLVRAGFREADLGGRADLGEDLVRSSRIHGDERAILTLLRIADALETGGAFFDIEIDGVPVRVHARIDSVEKRG